MRKFFSLFIFSLFISSVVKGQAPSNDSCSNATILCANNTLSTSNAGATVSAGDPALDCGDHTLSSNVWFTVTGISNGTATVTVSKIDSTLGLEMEVYTGTCGSLVTTGQCATGVGPNGSMNVIFSTTPGTVYYIMVNGTGGNQETFNILATSSTNSIIAKPDADFIADPDNGCAPLSVSLDSTSIIYGGTNITFQWQFDSGPLIPASGSDTTVLFSSTGTHTVALQVCNNECLCKTSLQDIVVQHLVPSFSYSPNPICVGTSVQFTGSATILPTPPSVNPDITSWVWNFGDPNSGANNTASTQNPAHTFVGPGTSFNVQLIVQGQCGPDTAALVVNLLQKPILHPITDQVICQGSSANLTVTVDHGTNPITYNWSGPGTIACPACSSTSVSGLAPGGPYTFTINITDGNGCVADSSTQVTVNPTPVVKAGNDTTVCKYSTLTLSPTITTGTGPFTYAWSPATGLNDSTLKNPTVTITGSMTYCLTVKDSIGCTSDTSCININIYPDPTITSSHATYCASDPGPDTTTFTVNGAHSGSIYSWRLSPNYSLITGTNSDSSSIKVTFPTGVAATYNFIVIVNDGVTGCTDTVPESFTVTNGINMTVNGPFTICAGNFALLTASNATTYAWTAIPPYTFADSTLASQNVSPVVTTNFIVEGSTGTCTKVDTIHVTVNPLPIANADSISPFCGCATVALNGTRSSPGMIYLWTSTNGSMIANPNSQFTTAYTCSSGIFILTVTDASTGCSKSDSVPANNLPKPAAAAHAVPSLICNGTTTMVTLSGAGSDTASGTTYQWSSQPVVSIANTTAISTSATVTGFAVFYFTVTSASGCDSTVTDTVNVYPPPTISVSPGSLCTSSPFAMDTISIQGASPGSTYNWTVIPPCVTPHSTSAQSQAFNFSTCGVGIYPFTIIVADAVTGCVDTVNTSVNIVNGVTLTVSPNQIICQGDSAILVASGANTYLWNNNATTATIVVKGLTTAMSPDTFIVAGAIGSCIAVDTTIVTINPTPVTSAINGIVNVCENDSTGIYSVTGHSGDIYTWSVTGGGSITSGQGTDSIVVKWGAPGPVTISVYETNSVGCTSVAQTLNITVNPSPVTSSITGDTIVCAISTDPYSVSAVAGSTYQWSVSGGAFSGPSTGNSVSIIWGVGPSGTVNVVETNSGGCSGDTVTLNVNIYPLPAAPVIVGPDTLCADSLGVTYSVTNHAGSMWLWSVTGGSITTSPDSSQVTVNWGSAVTTSIQVVEVNSNGCMSAPDTLVVTLDSIPVPSPINGSDSVCVNDSDIYAVNPSPGSIYTWTVTGGSIASGQGTDTIMVSWGAAGAGTITISEANPIGCKGAPETLNVTINPKPSTSPIIGDTTACQNSIQPYWVDSTAGSTYQWTVTGGTISGSSTDTLVSVVWGAPPTGTVKVVETNAAGCIGDTVLLNVTIYPPPATPVIVGPDTLCADSLGVIYSVTNHAGSTWLWTITGGTITTSPDSSQVTVNWDSAGTASIQVVEVSANGCLSAPDTLVVTLDTIPVPSAISGNISVCLNDTDIYYVAAASPGTSYIWTVTGGSILSGQGTDSIQVAWGTAGAGTITISEANPIGCKGAPDTLNVIIIPKPSTSLISGDTTACQNSTQPYWVSSTAGSMYQWTVMGGTISGSSTDTLVSVVWGTPPTGIVKVIETNAAGCIGDTVTLNVTILPVPATPVISGADTSCADSLGAVYSVVNNVGSYYLWTVTGGTIASPNDSSSQINVNWGNAGADTIHAVEVNANGCSSLSATLIVIVDSLPVTSPIVGDTSVCANDTAVKYYVNKTAGDIYNWSVTGGSLSAGQGTDTILVNWAGQGTGQITVIETSPAGCAGMQQVLPVIIHSIPDSTKISGVDSVCAGSTVSYTATGDTGSTFVWTATNGNIVGSDSASIISVTWGTPGAGLLQVIETSKYGCSAAPVFLNITVNPVPHTSPITGNDTVCINDTGNIYFVTPTAGSIYTWSLVGGTITSGQGTDSVSVTWNNSGLDSIFVTETNKFGCVGLADTGIIIGNPMPHATAFASVTTLCQLDSVHLTATDSNTASVNWYTSGSGTFTNDTAISSAYITGVNDSGIIVLTLVAHNPPCANDTVTISLTVNPIPHLTIVPASPTICFGDTDTLVVSGVGSYLWTPGNDTTSSIIVHPSATTTYYVNVRNNYGCSASDSDVVTVFPAGIATAGPNQSICRGDSVYLSGLVVNAGGGQWTSNGNGTFLPNPFTLNAIYVPGSNDTSVIQLVLTTTGSCRNGSDTLKVTFSLAPTVNAGLDQTIAYRDSAHLNGLVTNAGGGIWSTNGTGYFLPSDTSLIAIYVPSAADLQQDSIILTLTATGGCKVVSAFMVIHFNEFMIPNVFTPYPNTPGYNDYFEIKGLPPDSKLQVWNRWGLLVYESDNYLNNWDGENVPTDVYYYVIITTKTEYHGWVEVIK